MKMILAIVVCKLLRFVGKLVGKGSSLPGKYAPLYAGGLIAKRVLAAFGAAQNEEKDRGDGR